jgi:hypothetical protein
MFYYRARDMALSVEYLPSKPEVLSSIPSTTKTKTQHLLEGLVNCLTTFSVSLPHHSATLDLCNHHQSHSPSFP